MAKKVDRKMQHIGSSQEKTEKEIVDKFSDTKDIAHGKQETVDAKGVKNGRLSPQISCTVLPEDKQLLNDLAIFAINKSGKPLNTSTIIRALIRLGHKKKEELEF